MLTPKMQMVGSRSAADLAFEGEGGGGRLVGCLQIYSTLDSDVEGIPVARVSNKYVEVH